MAPSSSRFALLCVLGYVAASWAWRFDTPDGPHNASLTYPFDTYSMYAHVMPEGVARIVARTADGATERVAAYRSFRCDPPLDVSHRCAGDEGTTIEYVDDDLARWVADHPGGGDERIEIVRRSWSLRGSAAVRTHDCVLTTCMASE